MKENKGSYCPVKNSPQSVNEQHLKENASPGSKNCQFVNLLLQIDENAH